MSIFREEILELKAYHVPDSAGMVKLDAMENPYSLPAALREEVGKIASGAEINRYPDPHANSLKERLRKSFSIPENMEILLGNGSDEIIQMMAMALSRKNSALMSLEPAFVMYKMIATFVGMDYIGIPLKSDFSIDIEKTLGIIDEKKPALIFIAYPNNPTGNLYDEESIMKIVKKAPGIVVIDEAYSAFAGKSFVGKLDAFDNLLLMRTLSKIGLAGLRLGFLVGRKQWIEQFEKVRMPYNINSLTQIVAEKLLRSGTVFAEQAEKIKLERSRVFEEMKKIPDITPYPSAANFILFRTNGADAIYQNLKKKGILIKNLDGGHPLLAHCLRVTIGTPEENDQFLHALEA